MRRLVLVVVLAVVVAMPLTARGGVGWKSHQAQGLSVSLPSSWANAMADRKRILSESRRLARSDPELSRIIDGLLAAGTASTAVRLHAFDLDRRSLRSGFVTNLNVIAEKTELTFAEWRQASIKALTSMAFVRQPVWSRVVRLPAGKAVRFTYRADFMVGARRLETAITQYGIVERGVAYTLTYTTVPSLAARYRAVFARSARSLRPH